MLSLLYAAVVVTFTDGCVVVPCVICCVAVGAEVVEPNKGTTFKLFPRFCIHIYADTQNIPMPCLRTSFKLLKKYFI